VYTDICIYFRMCSVNCHCGLEMQNFAAASRNFSPRCSFKLVIDPWEVGRTAIEVIYIYTWRTKPGKGHKIRYFS